MTNFGSETETKTIGYTVKDVNGTVIAEGEKDSSPVNGNLDATDTISFDVQKYGYYTVDAFFLNNGVKESLKTKSFAYIDPSKDNSNIKQSNTDIGFASHYDWYGFDDKTMNNEAVMMQTAGLDIERQDFLWKVVEPVNDQFDWNDYDKVVDANYNHGIETLAILAYTSLWGSSAPDGAENKDIYPPKSVDDYADFVYNVVSRYKDKIKTWEIWNEPNIDGFFRPASNADAYFEVLKAGYLAAKRADPAMQRS